MHQRIEHYIGDFWPQFRYAFKVSDLMYDLIRNLICADSVKDVRGSILEGTTSKAAPGLNQPGAGKVKWPFRAADHPTCPPPPPPVVKTEGERQTFIVFLDTKLPFLKSHSSLPTS